MSDSPSSSRWNFQDVLALLARWFCGALFIYTGYQKAMDPVTFLKLVRQYEIVSNPYLLNSIASTLPWFEIFCGVLLILGVAVRGTAVILLTMLIPFTLAVLKRALDMASTQGLAFCTIKFDCGCGTGEEVICTKLMVNSAIILVSAWLLTLRNGKLCARFQLAKAMPSSPTPQPGIEGSSLEAQ